MKFGKWKQWKTVALTLLLVITIIVTAGGSLAYFTDSRETTNVFTAGNVYISLSEAEVKRDEAGNLVEDPDKERIQGAEIGSVTDVVKDYGSVYPGQTVWKDPTVKNVGDDSAWVAMKVIISDGAGDLHKIMGYYGVDAIDIEILLGGGLLDERIHVGDWNGISNVCYNDRYAMAQIPNRTEGVYDFYFFMLQPLQKGEEVTIFDTLTIDPSWNNEDMQELKELQIQIQAFAVQKFGFTDCFSAMQEAFSEHFANCV